jgi:hypothetical protein
MIFKRFLYHKFSTIQSRLAGHLDDEEITLLHHRFENLSSHVQGSLSFHEHMRRQTVGKRACIRALKVP